MIEDWLKGDPATLAPSEARLNVRNADWVHLHVDDVLSMPAPPGTVIVDSSHYPATPKIVQLTHKQV